MSEIGEILFKVKADLAEIDKSIADIQRKFDSKPIKLKLALDDANIRDIQNKLTAALGSKVGGAAIGMSTGSASTSISPLSGILAGGIAGSMSQKGIQQLSATIGAYTTQGMSCPQCGNVVPPNAMNCPRCGNVLKTAAGNFARAGGRAIAQTARGIGFVGNIVERGLDLAGDVGNAITGGIHAAQAVGGLVGKGYAGVKAINKYIDGKQDRTIGDLYDLHSVTSASMDQRLSSIHSTISSMNNPSDYDIGVAVNSASQFPYDDNGKLRRRKPKPPKSRKPKGGGGGMSTADILANAPVASGYIAAGIVNTEDNPSYKYTTMDSGEGLHSWTDPVSGGLKGYKSPINRSDSGVLGRGLSGGKEDAYAAPQRSSSARRYGGRSAGFLNIGAISDGVGSLASNIGRDLSRTASNIGAGISAIGGGIGNGFQGLGGGIASAFNPKSVGVTGAIAMGTAAAWGFGAASQGMQNRNNLNINLAGSNSIWQSINAQQNHDSNATGWRAMPLIGGAVGGFVEGMNESIYGEKRKIASMESAVSYANNKNSLSFMSVQNDSKASGYLLGGQLRRDPNLLRAGVSQKTLMSKESIRQMSVAEQAKNSERADKLDIERNALDDDGVTGWWRHRKKIASLDQEAKEIRAGNKVIQRNAGAAATSADKLGNMENYQITRDDKRYDVATSANTSRISTSADAMSFTADNKPFHAQIRSAAGNYAADIRTIQSSDMKPEAKSIAMGETARLNAETMREIKHQISLQKYGGLAVDFGGGVNFAQASTRERMKPEDLNAATDYADKSTGTVNNQDNQSHKDMTKEEQDTRKVVNANTEDSSQNAPLFERMTTYLQAISLAVTNGVAATAR